MMLVDATVELLQGWIGPTTLLVDGRRYVEIWDSEKSDIDLQAIRPALLEGLLEDRYLDLNRRECRDRVKHCISVVLGYDDLHRGTIFRLTKRGDAKMVGSGWTHTWPKEIVDGLQDLDASDDTRLEDGSRRVEAVALAIVWNEVKRQHS